MRKPILVCDLDDSFINTRRLKSDLFALAKYLGVANPQRIYKRTFTKCSFSFPVFSQALFPERASACPQKIRFMRCRRANRYLAQAWQLLRKPKAYNFPGVENFCKTLSKKYALILLTYGQKNHQLLKLRQSGLKKYFTGVIVTNERSKRKALLKLRARYGPPATLCARLQRCSSFGQVALRAGPIMVLDNSNRVIKTSQALGLRYCKLKSGLKSVVYYRQVLKKIT